MLAAFTCLATIGLVTHHAEPRRVAIFGVFDGHGGKQAATFASRQLLARLQAALPSATVVHEGLAAAAADSGVAGGSRSGGGGGSSSMADELTTLRAQLAELGASEDALASADGADALAAALPAALAAAFAATERDFLTRNQESGTTATVAAVAGWQVLVANVGDSLAFLDTGSEVIQVTQAG